MAILGMSFFHLAAGTESLTDGYMLTSQGGMVLEAVFLIVIFLVSVFQKLYHRKRREDEDEDEE